MRKAAALHGIARGVSPPRAATHRTAPSRAATHRKARGTVRRFNSTAPPVSRKGARPFARATRPDYRSFATE